MSTNSEEKKETLPPKQIDKGKSKGHGKISLVTVIIGLVAGCNIKFVYLILIQFFCIIGMILNIWVNLSHVGNSLTR